MCCTDLAHIALVGNKVDLSSKRVVSDSTIQVQKNYSRIEGLTFIKGSNGENGNTIFRDQRKNG